MPGHNEITYDMLIGIIASERELTGMYRARCEGFAEELRKKEAALQSALDDAVRLTAEAMELRERKEEAYEEWAEEVRSLREELGRKDEDIARLKQQLKEEELESKCVINHKDLELEELEKEKESWKEEALEKEALVHHKDLEYEELEKEKEEWKEEALEEHDCELVSGLTPLLEVCGCEDVGAAIRQVRSLREELDRVKGELYTARGADIARQIKQVKAEDGLEKEKEKEKKVLRVKGKKSMSQEWAEAIAGERLTYE